MRVVVLMTWVLLGVAFGGSQAGEPPAPLVVVTWNVLGDPAERASRLPALLQTLESAKPDVIAIQEATTWFTTALVSQPWAADLRRYPLDADQAFPGGLAIFTRLPAPRCQVIELPTQMARCGVVLEMATPQGPWVMGVVHLDSQLNDGPTRGRQLQVMGQALRAHPDALLVGDFNFGDGEPESADIPLGFVDVWSALRTGEPGFTWNLEQNPLAKAGSFPDEPSRRLDRICLRSTRWRAGRIDLIGTVPIAGSEGRLFPSDHFGLRVELRSP